MDITSVQYHSRQNISLHHQSTPTYKINTKYNNNNGNNLAIIPLNTTNNQYKSVTADLEEAKLDTGESLSIIKIISFLRELLA